MKVVASCGHTLTPEEDFGIPVCVRDPDGSRLYSNVCLKCYDQMKRDDVLLPFDEQPHP